MPSATSSVSSMLIWFCAGLFLVSSAIHHEFEHSSASRNLRAGHRPLPPSATSNPAAKSKKSLVTGMTPATNDYVQSSDLHHIGELILKLFFLRLGFRARHRIVFILMRNDQVVELALSRTCRDEVSYDNVLLHTHQPVGLTTDGSLTEYLGGLLERRS